MAKRLFGARRVFWEVCFQILLLALVFIFYSMSKRHPQVEEYEIAFFLNYAIASYLIMYLLLPLFLYKKKYLQFALFTTLLIAIVILLEEGVIEKIYFPTTRGRGFPGVFDNLASAMPTITILTGFKFAWDALVKQTQVEELQSAVKESELQFLKTQINPHFLFNNLNNLYAHALEQSPKTPEIILELSGVMRYMLYECHEQFVALDKEIGQLRNFVNLSRLQCEGRAEVTFDTEESFGQYHIAPLILNVFVENAFKHSLSSQSENIRIHIQISVSGRGHLRFECTNTFSPQSNTHDLSRGIGLENVCKRLELLYPKSHALEIDVKNDTYRVLLEMDLDKNSES